MNNPIALSTAFLYRQIDCAEERIAKLLDLSPDGIEMLFIEPKNVLEFNPSNELMQRIASLQKSKSLRYTSIHAPWRNVVYGKNQECRQMLHQLENICHAFNARNITIHRKGIQDFSVFYSYSFHVSIENDDWKKPANTVESIGELLSTNPGLMFTFDFAHALTVNPVDIPEYISRFRQRISQVHLHYTDRNQKYHCFLHKKDSPELRQSLSYLKPLNVPLVLECIAETEQDIPLVKSEIEYIRKI